MVRQALTSAVLLSAVAWPLQAQETTSGSLAGRVLDVQQSAVAGADVTVTSEQGSRTFKTDATGSFFAPFLTPGKYSVNVRLAGFATVERQGIEVHLGQRLALLFTLKVGDLHEVIDVVSGSPVVDTHSTTIGGNLSSDVLKRLPVGRNFTDTLYLVPGVSDSSGVGRANPSIGGASGLDNAYIIDGVNIADEGYGGVGTYSAVFGSLGTGVTTDFVKETQVKTGGFEAEYGMATGGVVNVLTQSGTNEFHGQVFGYLRPQWFESAFRQLDTPNGNINREGTQQLDFGVAAGGPVVKDKVLLFGLFNPQFLRDGFRAPKGFPLASLGSVDRKRHSYSYAGKLTYQVSSNHTLNLSAFGDPSRGDNGPQRPISLIGDDTEAFSAINYGGHQQVLRYDGVLSQNWLIEAAIAHSQNHFTENPSANTNYVTNGLVTPVRITGGIGPFLDTRSHRYDYQLKSTNMFRAAGRHQLRYGVDLEDVEYDVTNGVSGPTFIFPDGTPSVSGAQIAILPDPTYGAIYSVQWAYIQKQHNTPQKYFSAFLQDTWQVGRLALRPGVRYEQERLTGDPPLCHANDSEPGAADGTGPLVACSFSFSGNWAPRIGTTYDVSGNGKTKLYASFSRFYVRLPNNLAARSLTSDAAVLQADYFDPNLTQPVPEGVDAGGRTTHYLTSTSPEIIDPKAKLTFSQEFVVGFEFQAAQAINLGVRYIHRTLPRVLEDAAQVPVVAYYSGVAPDNIVYRLTNIAPGNPAIPDLPGLPSGISEERPVRTYDAIEVTANKSFSDNWSLIASYRYSKLQGNYEGFYKSDIVQSDPAITTLFDFPIDDPSYTEVGGPQYGFQGDIRYQGCALGCGVLPNDRPHQLKIAGQYSFKELNVGLALNAGSGRALTGLYANPVYNTIEIPDGPRGSGIQTVDGFMRRTPFEFLVDVRLDYTFRISKSQRILVSADVFNVFNNQNPTAYDVYHDLAFQVPNPNFGQPVNGGGSVLTSFQTPRQVRLGARFEW